VSLQVTTAPQILGQRDWPAVPSTVADLEVPRAVISDLFLRSLWQHGSATLSLLQKTLKLPFAVLETFFQQFRQQQVLDVTKVMGNDSSFLLTAAGRALAAARIEVCQYVGPAPVSLRQYERVVRAQAARVQLTPESLRQAFSDLVLPDELLNQLGPSLVAHQSLFLYGDTGGGKTSIAERIIGDEVPGAV
jgi:hypothetical protein